jgi:small subunit ribosomal protein S7
MVQRRPKEEENNMPRRGAPRQRKFEGDAKFSNLMVTKLINRSMYDGKKSVAEKQVYKALELIQKETKENPIAILTTALDNIRPTMEVRPRRVGGAAYQVPMPVRGTRRDSLAIRWLITATRARSNSEYHTYGEKLAAEILAASKMEGGAVKKRLEVEKVAEANRAFSHFRW